MRANSGEEWMKAKLASSVIALALIAGAGHALAQNPEADARFERLKAEREAEAERQREAQRRYEQGVRDAEAARARYEADLARHNEEVRRAEAAQANYRQRRADYDAQTGVAAVPRAERRSEIRRESREARSINAQCQRRARRRGRLLGGLIGGIVARNGGSAAEMVAISAPVSLLMGEAISRLLDCREQEQAAAATEQVVEQAAAAPPATEGGAARGVGTTVAWTSETRPGVTGSSTVTGLEQEPGGGECMTVTDIVIVDGQETRAPKRLCRRPPSQRFVRV
jgi:hypothetical protein